MCFSDAARSRAGEGTQSLPRRYLDVETLTLHHQPDWPFPPDPCEVL